MFSPHHSYEMTIDHIELVDDHYHFYVEEINPSIGDGVENGEIVSVSKETAAKLANVPNDENLTEALQCLHGKVVVARFMELDEGTFPQFDQVMPHP